MLAISLASIGAILVLHHMTPLRALGLHDLLRRFFYLPVTAIAIVGGARFGLLAAGLTALGYMPHLIQLARTGDRPGDHWMELVVLGTVAVLVGAFADSSRRARVLAEERGRLAVLGEVGIAVMSQVEGPLRSIEGQAESLSVASSRPEGGAAGFAAWAIQSESARIRRLLHDLRDLGRAGTSRPSQVNLSAFVEGIAEDVSAARPGRSPVHVFRSSSPIAVRGDQAALAYAFRSMLLSAWDAAPQPAWMEVELTVKGSPALRIGIRSQSGWVPDLERSTAGVFGAAVSEYRFQHALCRYLLRAQGVRASFERLSPAEACIRLEFAHDARRRPDGDPQGSWSIRRDRGR